MSVKSLKPVLQEHHGLLSLCQVSQDSHIPQASHLVLPGSQKVKIPGLHQASPHLILRLLTLCVPETSPGSSPAWPRGLHTIAGEHRPVSCHCSVKGRRGLNGGREGICFQIAGSQRGKKLTCSLPQHPLPALHQLSLRSGGQRSCRRPLASLSALSQGEAGKERELPFLEASSVPSPGLAVFHHCVMKFSLCSVQ